MLVRPTFQENLYKTLFQLSVNTEFYYLTVFRNGKSIFKSLGFEEEVKKIDDMIKSIIEEPFNRPLTAVLEAYELMKNRNSNYFIIGDVIDYKEVTTWEITQRLDYIKDYIFDRLTELSPLIRFTSNADLYA